MSRGYSQAKSSYYGRGSRFNPFGNQINRSEDFGDGTFGDDEGNVWDSQGRTIAGDGLSGDAPRSPYYRERRAPNVEGQAMVKHIKTGEATEASIKALSPEEAPTYKAARKAAVAAFDAAEDKAKTDWQAANPGKEYAGKPRQGFVNDGLKAVTELLIANKVEPKIADLVVKKIGYDKDKFLRLKGHYSSNYEHINIPSIA
jgi:hypothetical protein